MPGKTGRLCSGLLLGALFIAGGAGAATRPDNDYFIGPDAVENLLGGGRGVVGLGLNWGRPNDEFYDNHRSQHTAELFCRLEEGPFQITPDLQLIRNPADAPDRRQLVVFGLRLAVRF